MKSPCPTCNGTGTFTWTVADKNGEHTESMPCPVCHGTGQVDRPDPDQNNLLQLIGGKS